MTLILHKMDYILGSEELRENDGVLELETIEDFLGYFADHPYMFVFSQDNQFHAIVSDTFAESILAMSLYEVLGKPS